MNSKVRAWWWSKQGLDGSLRGQSPSTCLAKSGWSRSVGGASPYIGIYSRTGTTRAEIDAAILDEEIHELPAARACTYVIPRAEYPLALTVAAIHGQDADFNLAKRHLGVTDDEIHELCAAVVLAVSKEALDPKEIKMVVGDKARSLGEDGRKRGISSTLPIALGRLQVNGSIRRVPADGRLDRQRYKYTIWSPNPLRDYDRSDDEALTELAQRFWRWAGPASPAHFQKFSGLGVKAAKSIVEKLDLVPVEDGSGLLLARDELSAYHAFEAPSAAMYSLVGSLDPAVLTRWEIEPLLEEVDKGRETATDKAAVPITSLQDLYSNAILDRGRLVGLWEYDPFAKELVSVSFVPRTPPLTQAIEAMEAFVREQLEDCRSFSLDSPESRKPKLAILREMAAKE